MLFVWLGGCTVQKENKSDPPVARVFSEFLYLSDIKQVVPSGLTREDSTALANEFIDKWIRDRLLQNKAEENLSDEEKNVELQIEHYRSSLLIYAYQQSYLRQKLDTVVTESEVRNYYEDNESSFLLNKNLIRGVFIQLPRQTTEVYKLRQFYRLDDAESIRKTEAYCFEHATRYDHFNDGWVALEEVLQLFPPGYGRQETAVMQRKYLEARDSLNLYFLDVNEAAPEGSVKPFGLVEHDIRNIILNKRKLELISTLEKEIFQDAQNRDHFKIYP